MTDETDRKSKLQSNDKAALAELGYSERRTRPARGTPGRVGFDELGNAQYQWQDDRMLEDGDVGETRRHRALSVANLVLVDDEPPPDLKTITPNKNGMRLGYNPYDSGRLKKEQWKKPRDLRALSKWIEARKHSATGQFTTDQLSGRQDNDQDSD